MLASSEGGVCGGVRWWMVDDGDGGGDSESGIMGNCDSLRFTAGVVTQEKTLQQPVKERDQRI